MRTITVDEVQVGDVVVEPVHDAQGRMLLPVGSKISPAVMSRLADWGVTQLCVEGDRVEAPDGAPDSAGSEELAALEHRFSDVKGDPLMDRIQAVARSHLVRKER